MKGETFILILLLLSALSLLFIGIIESDKIDYQKEVPCYDVNHNPINNVTCLEKCSDMGFFYKQCPNRVKKWKSSVQTRDANTNGIIREKVNSI